MSPILSVKSIVIISKFVISKVIISLSQRIMRWMLRCQINTTLQFLNATRQVANDKKYNILVKNSHVISVLLICVVMGIRQLNMNSIVCRRSLPQIVHFRRTHIQIQIELLYSN
jgi:hypothetical protein